MGFIQTADIYVVPILCQSFQQEPEVEQNTKLTQLQARRNTTP